MSQNSEDEDSSSPYSETAKYFGGLVLLFLGVLVSITVVGIVIGIPMMIAGYAIYKSSSLAEESGESRIDYRE
ncbi:DUF5362 family protein [Halorutilales archaeon Cl-col2-1]